HRDVAALEEDRAAQHEQQRRVTERQAPLPGGTPAALPGPVGHRVPFPPAHPPVLGYLLIPSPSWVRIGRHGRRHIRRTWYHRGYHDGAGPGPRGAGLRHAVTVGVRRRGDRKSTRLNSSHVKMSY